MNLLGKMKKYNLNVKVEVKEIRNVEYDFDLFNDSIIESTSKVLDTKSSYRIYTIFIDNEKQDQAYNSKNAVKEALICLIKEIELKKYMQVRNKKACYRKKCKIFIEPLEELKLSTFTYNPNYHSYSLKNSKNGGMIVFNDLMFSNIYDFRHIRIYTLIKLYEVQNDLIKLISIANDMKTNEDDKQKMIEIFKQMLNEVKVSKKLFFE